MKEFIKDYGAIVGALTAFLLGVFALYVKYSIDRKLDERKTQRRLKKLIQLVKQSPPPSDYHPKKSEDGFHADQARNLTNLSIFANRVNVLSMFIDKIEGDVMVHATLGEVQQFHYIKFIVRYLMRDIEQLREDKKSSDTKEKVRLADISQNDLSQLWITYNSIVDVCEDPSSHFFYIGSGKRVEVSRETNSQFAGHKARSPDQ